MIGITNHYGDMNSGHYNAQIKNNNCWYLVDDGNVMKQENTENIVTDAAYILFYKKKD